LLSTIAFIFVLSVLIIAHEFGHFIAAKRSGVKVEKFSLGFGPKLLGLKRGDTEYMICAVPLGGYIKMAGDSFEEKITGQSWEFFSKSPGVRARIIFAGPLLNYILGFLLFCLVFMVGNPMVTSKVGELLDGYPAKAYGIQKGDRIIAIDGKKIDYWENLIDVVHNKTEGEMDLTIKRGDSVLFLKITPKVEEKKDIFGSTRKIALLGVIPSDEVVTVKYDPLSAVYLAAKKVLLLTQMTFKALFYIIIGKMSVKESVTGPVGIFILTGKAAELGFIYLLQMMAILSTSLAIFNVLPIPVLDGGHMLFIVIEKLRRKAVSPRVQEITNQAGMYVLIGLMFLVFYSDFAKFGIFDKIFGIFKK